MQERKIAEEKIICISWKSPSQAARADTYYHAECYNACPVALPGGEKRELHKSEVARYTICAACGWYINF